MLYIEYIIVVVLYIQPINANITIKKLNPFTIDILDETILKTTN